MAYQVIGHSICPCCALQVLMGLKKVSDLKLQEVRLSEKNKKPYINCDECGSQTFSRQPVSVHTLKCAAVHAWELPKPVTSIPTEPSSPPKPEQDVPTAPPKPVSPKKPEPVKSVEPKAKPAETTIFDWILPK